MSDKPALTDSTWDAIRALFPPEHHATVAHMLESECGNNLPFLEQADAKTLERYHLAALKLSRGTLDGLRQAVDLAKTDWRDLLVAAEDMDKPRRGWRRWLRKA
jgi:hypothetical protein